MLNYFCGGVGAAAYVQLVPIGVTAADKPDCHIGPRFTRRAGVVSCLRKIADVCEKENNKINKLWEHCT